MSRIKATDNSDRTYTYNSDPLYVVGGTYIEHHK